MIQDTIEIMFMRHGRSRADDEQVHEGRYDAPLTGLGRAQAERRATELNASGITFDAIVASPLKRAHETAGIIGSALNMGVDLDEDWMETDNGPLAGLPFQVASRTYPIPGFHNPFQPHVVSAGEGESTWSLHSRAARALERVIRRGRGSYLVVAHGGILNAAMGCIVGAQPTVSGQGVTFSFADTGYIRTAYDPNRHHWVIRELVHG